MMAAETARELISKLDLKYDYFIAAKISSRDTIAKVVA
jgi:hypothetical protein